MHGHRLVKIRVGEDACRNIVVNICVRSIWFIVWPVSEFVCFGHKRRKVIYCPCTLFSILWYIALLGVEEDRGTMKEIEENLVLKSQLSELRMELEVKICSLNLVCMIWQLSKQLQCLNSFVLYQHTLHSYGEMNTDAKYYSGRLISSPPPYLNCADLEDRPWCGGVGVPQRQREDLPLGAPWPPCPHLTTAPAWWGQHQGKCWS